MSNQENADHKSNVHNLVMKALELAGSQSVLSREMGVTRSAVYYWVRHGTNPGARTVLDLTAFIKASSRKKRNLPNNANGTDVPGASADHEV